MAQETTVKLTRGEDNAIVATNDAGLLKRLKNMGFEVAEEEDGVKFLEIPSAYVTFRRPKQTRELSADERAARRARLQAGKANKVAATAPAPAPATTRSRAKAAPTPPPAPPVQEPTPISSAKGKKGKAEAAPPTEAPAEAPKTSLSGRLKITR